MKFIDLFAGIGGRGGARPGGGRPKGSCKQGELRKMRSTRATNEEWEQILTFAKILKRNPERAKRMLETE